MDYEAVLSNSLIVNEPKTKKINCVEDVSKLKEKIT